MFLNQLEKIPNILVVGDLMLDRYWFGAVDRISPEAPVPVLSAERTDVRAGGAANVAMNLAELGANTSLLSVIGDDDAGRTATDLLGSAGVNRHLHLDQAMNTTEKLRIISRQQHLLRVDFEHHPSPEVLERCALDYQQLVRTADVVVLSDYGKGGLGSVQAMIELARGRGLPVVVDPKGSEYGNYRGATVVTPNLQEYELVVGAWQSEAEMSEMAAILLAKHGLSQLLVTRGAGGMTLFRLDEPPLSFPAKTQEVYDVTGAGDTVAAVVAMGLAMAASWSDVLSVANAAAGVVVGKLGTAVATLEEIKTFLGRR